MTRQLIFYDITSINLFKIHAFIINYRIKLRDIKLWINFFRERLFCIPSFIGANFIRRFFVVLFTNDVLYVMNLIQLFPYCLVGGWVIITATKITDELCCVSKWYKTLLLTKSSTLYFPFYVMMLIKIIISMYM